MPSMRRDHARGGRSLRSPWASSTITEVPVVRHQLSQNPEQPSLPACAVIRVDWCCTRRSSSGSSSSPAGGSVATISAAFVAAQAAFRTSSRTE